MNQVTLSCNWCGKFVVSMPPQSGTGEGAIRSPGVLLFEIFTDESGRLVKGENEAFLISREHRCKVVCGGCGHPVILEKEKMYDRPEVDESQMSNFGQREAVLQKGKTPHVCKKVMAPPQRT